MKKTIIWVVVVLVVVGVIVLVSRKNPNSINNSTRPFKIGVSVSITGSAAFIGESYLSGLKVAQEEINTNGGISGRPIELYVEDNKNSAQDGLSAFRALELRKPDLIIQTMSAATVPVAPVAKKSGIPLFVSLVFANVLPADDNAVSFFPRPSDDAQATVEDMQAGGIKKVGIVWVNTEYGKASLDAFTSEVGKVGITITASEPFLGDAKDFTTPVLKVLDTKPEAVYIIALNSIPLVDQIKLKADHPVIYANLIPLFGSLIYKNVETFDDVHLTAPLVSIPGTPEYQSFSQKMNGVIDPKTNTFGYTSIGYDNLYAIAEVLRKNPSAKDFVQTFTHFGEFDGVNGAFDLNARDVGMKIYPVVFKNGSIVPVK
jgi:branched-chain amino acid transport system substrate-binding protein